MIQSLLLFLKRYIDHWTRPYDDMLVTMLIIHTASLELVKGEWVEFAPTRGCCGPFKLSGNCLPIFEYTVFEKSLMEFIAVRVEIAKPDRISFIARITSTTAPERHGEEIGMKDKYKAPFELLAQNLYRYFPFYTKHKVQK